MIPVRNSNCIFKIAIIEESYEHKTYHAKKEK